MSDPYHFTPEIKLPQQAQEEKPDYSKLADKVVQAKKNLANALSLKNIFRKR